MANDTVRTCRSIFAINSHCKKVKRYDYLPHSMSGCSTNEGITGKDQLDERLSLAPITLDLRRWVFREKEFRKVFDRWRTEMVDECRSAPDQRSCLAPSW